MKSTCPRRFEAEAMRDGRLGDAEVANFERHLTICGECAREVQELESLRRGLRDVPAGEEPVDELRVRRERTRLLAAFDAALVPTTRPEQRGSWPLAIAAALLAVVVGFYGVTRGRRAALTTADSRNDRATSMPNVHDDDAVDVQADGAAHWSRHVEGADEKVVLERGALSIRVDHARRKRRLIVVLPDGELEDIGTRFTVSADQGRTTRVAIQEGSVVLRIRGRGALALGAGESWTPAPSESPASCGSCEPAGPASSLGRAAPPVQPTFPRSAAHAGAGDTEASVDFRAAMGAFDRGDNAAAAARFAAFLGKYPRDARAEDAAYLRVIAFRRASDVESMKGAAREYLRRYPNGFRRAEVEGL